MENLKPSQYIKITEIRSSVFPPKEKKDGHTRTRIQLNMSRLFALALLFLGSARAQSTCVDSDNGALDTFNTGCDVYPKTVP